jgi:hypothetical protein
MKQPPTTRLSGEDKKEFETQIQKFNDTALSIFD